MPSWLQPGVATRPDIAQNLTATVAPNVRGWLVETRVRDGVSQANDVLFTVSSARVLVRLVPNSVRVLLPLMNEKRASIGL